MIAFTDIIVLDMKNIFLITHITTSNQVMLAHLKVLIGKIQFSWWCFTLHMQVVKGEVPTAQKANSRPWIFSRMKESLQRSSLRDCWGLSLEYKQVVYFGLLYWCIVTYHHHHCWASSSKTPSSIRDGRGSYFFHGAGRGGEGQGQKSKFDALLAKKEEGAFSFYFLLHILLTGWIGHCSVL